MNSKIINFLLFQAGWFICVLGAANEIGNLAALLTFLLVLLHLVINQRKMETGILIVMISIVGWAWDSILAQIGMLSYMGALSSGVAPLWIAAMWAIFATTIDSSMKWLEGQYFMALILGAIFGPLAYYSASKLGAVEILVIPNAFLIQSLAWAIFLPLMFWFNQVLNRTPLSILKASEK